MKPTSPVPWLPTYCCAASYTALVLAAIASMFGQVEMAVMGGIALLCYVNTPCIKR